MVPQGWSGVCLSRRAWVTASETMGSQTKAGGGVCSVIAVGATPAEALRPCWAVALMGPEAPRAPQMTLIPNGK